LITSEQKNQIEVLEQSGSPAPAARVVPSEQLWLRSCRGSGATGGGRGAPLPRAAARAGGLAAARRDSASVKLERSKLLAALPLRQPPDGFGEWGIGDYGVGRPDGPLGRPVRCGLWAAFQLDANYRHKIVKSRNFETLTILYMYIPLRTTKNFPKNVGYAREYPGTTVGPPMLVIVLVWLQNMVLCSQL